MVKKKDDPNTEQQILEAARNVFRQKGLAGARMQEIADAAKINKAMLHYYFRSKDQLFQRIFLETLMSFFGTVVMTLNDPSTAWDEKILTLSGRYIDFLKTNPDMPLFVLNEMNQGHKIFEHFPMPDALRKSVFVQQLKTAQAKKEIREIDPLQVIISLVSGLVFPFVSRPILSTLGGLSEKKFNQFLEERKEIVPGMIINYLKNNIHITNSKAKTPNPKRKR